ncbi:hypothetical protein Q9L58_010914, partial [Maublancomyces gigas]
MSVPTLAETRCFRKSAHTSQVRSSNVGKNLARRALAAPGAHDAALDLCMAAVTTAPHILGSGIDVEINAPLDRKLETMICTAASVAVSTRARHPNADEL